MTIEIISAMKAGDQSVVNGIVYGPSGIGKTVLAATAPKPLIVSAEKGLLSISDQEVDTTEIKSLKDLKQVYTYLLKETHTYETVVIDSLSEVAQVVLAEYAAEERDKRKAYGRMGEELLSIIRKFRDLPIHTIFNCKQARIVDEFSGKNSFGPKFPGRILDGEAPYQLDEVLALRFHKHEGKEFRVIQTGADIQYEAKDRSGMLKMFEKPNLTLLFEKILCKSKKEDLNEVNNMQEDQEI